MPYRNPSKLSNKLLLGVLCLLLGGFPTSAFSQENSPYPPLDIPLKLSGTFGEFRPTHFHAGIDIKTQGKEGFEVRAIDAGSIRRIRVATSGYGKCVYIEHNNGTTSVYAHLKKFAPKIEAYVKEQQYAQEQFLIQQFPKRNEIPIDANELIGYSGNTGSSQGPHLHFELRNTKNERPLNPLQLGYNIPDSIRPIVQGLYHYKIGEYGTALKTEIPLERKNDSTYAAELKQLAGPTGFGIRLFDRQDLSYNRNGIYKASLWVNGSKRFSYVFDSIDFQDGKKIDALIDYPTYKKERRRIQKLFRDINVDYSFLPEEAPDGIIDFEEGKSYQVKIVLEDYEKNTTTVAFYVEGIENLNPFNAPEFRNEVRPEKDYLFVFDRNEIYVPKNTFYTSVDFLAEAKSDTLVIKNIEQPQRKGFHLQFALPKNLDSIEKAQICLAKFNPKAKKKKNRLSYVWAYKKDSLLQTKSAYPGTYYLVKDSIPPSLTPLNFKEEQWMSNYNYLKLKMEDDFSGVNKYKGTINGQWILLEHEPKDKTLIYNFNDLHFDQAKLELEIEATDNAGNTTIYSTTLFRKAKTEKKS